MIELQLLQYILDKQCHETFLRIDPEWILDANVKAYYTFISGYKEKSTNLPSKTDFLNLMNNSEIFKDTKTISSDLSIYFIEQLKDKKNKYDFFSEMMDIFSQGADFSYSDMVDEIQSVLLKTEVLNDELVEIDFSEYIRSEEDMITKLPLGLGKFDIVNGGMSSSELFLLGGYRGSGKSVLALNCALRRFQMGKTTAFVSIEMRALEVGARIDSIVTGVPIRAIEKNVFSPEQLKLYYLRKAKFFCKPSEKLQSFLTVLETETDRVQLEKAYRTIPRKDNKFFLYDLPNCTPVNVNFIANKLKKQNALNFMVVDYLNIMKLSEKEVDPLDWKTQVTRSNALKTIARTNDIAIMAPIQVSEEGVIKFSKAIADVADYSIVFNKSKGENAESSNVFNLKTDKIRNGKPVSFSLIMNESNLRVTELDERPSDDTKETRDSS